LYGRPWPASQEQLAGKDEGYSRQNIRVNGRKHVSAKVTLSLAGECGFSAIRIPLLALLFLLFFFGGAWGLTSWSFDCGKSMIRSRGLVIFIGVSTSSFVLDPTPTGDFGISSSSLQSKFTSQNKSHWMKAKIFTKQRTYELMS
jgi:hypothetical protein